MEMKDLLNEGQLNRALEQLATEMKSQPQNIDLRYLLAELLCVSGEFERADKQLDIIMTQDPGSAVGVALFRQLIRAEQSRQDFFKSGGIPEFLGKPSVALEARLKACVLNREGETGETVRVLEEVNAVRKPLVGTCNNQHFDDFRDLDDLTSDVLEVLTSTGKYYWVPLSTVSNIEFHKPQKQRDLLWRRAHIEVTQGPDGEVFIPCIYPVSDKADTNVNEAALLGRSTDWSGDSEGPVRGIGQRSFLVDDDVLGIMEINSLSFETSDG